MPIREALERTLRGPTADELWNLRAELLEAGLPAGARVFAVLDEFRGFLDRLATGISSQQSSELASRLDIGAVGGVVLEQMLERESADRLALRLLTGVISEGLMVLATRQHVKAWQGELGSVHRTAAWFLYGELWSWAEQRKPELAAGERRRLLDTLFAPFGSAEVDDGEKVVLAGLLFQVVLCCRLAEAMPTSC